MPNREEGSSQTHASYGHKMLNMDDWEDFNRKITLGYYNPNGQWVPGTLEQMRDITTEMATNNMKLDLFIARDRVIDRWTLRAILFIALVRILGFNNMENLLHTFHLGGQ